MSQAATKITLQAQYSELLDSVPKQLLIDGKWVNAASGKTFETENPATGEVIARVAEADKEDVERAVTAARAALDRWSATKPSQRTMVLFKIAELIDKHAEELALLETLDNGKAIFESKNVDIPGAAEVFRYYAGWSTKIYGETNPSSEEFFNYTLREPVGVCGQIIPWNFPLLMASWKIAPALACGNTVVLKPAEQTPLTALFLGKLLLEAGVPKGVVNILPGYGETAGAAIASHMGIDKVAFTGSTAVGKEILKASAGNLKRVSLELGGKSPNIVFRDADLDAATVGAMLGIFFNQGQVCCAGSRLFVEEKVYEEFTDKVGSFAGGLKIGPGTDPETKIGPLVSKEQHDRVSRYLEIGKKEGAKVKAGGDVANDGDLKKGYFIKPTVFTGVKNSMQIAQEEIFGPVVSAIPFKDENDAVLQGNDTLYGLAAGVWTRDVSKAHRVARAIKAGTVWINCYNQIEVTSPFGGYKQSGFGRELGKHSLELYTQIKSVWLKM